MKRRNFLGLKLCFGELSPDDPQPMEDSDDDSNTSSNSSDLVKRQQQQHVREVMCLKTAEEMRTPWYPSPAFGKMLSTLKIEVDFENKTAKEKADHMLDVIKMIEKNVQLAKAHDRNDSGALYSRKEVVIFSGWVKMYVEDHERLRKLYHLPRIECDCAHGSSLMNDPKFYVESSDQIFVFILPEKIKIMENEVDKFSGLFECETHMTIFSHNAHLSRSDLKEVIPKSSTQGKELIAKLRSSRPPMVVNGKKWIMGTNEENRLVILPVPWQHSSKAYIEDGFLWAQRKKWVISYRISDLSMSLIAAIVLRLEWKKDPTECERLTSSELALLEACYNFRKSAHLQYSCSFQDIERSGKLPLQVYNRYGDLIYRGSSDYTVELDYENNTMLIALGFNGQFYPLKDSVRETYQAFLLRKKDDSTKAINIGGLSVTADSNE